MDRNIVRRSELRLRLIMIVLELCAIITAGWPIILSGIVTSSLVANERRARCRMIVPRRNIVLRRCRRWIEIMII